MPRAVLHNAISLTKMDRLSIIQLQNHLAANNYSVVHAIGSMHSRGIALEVLCHAWHLMGKLLEKRLVGTRIRFAALRRMWRKPHESKQGSSWRWERTLLRQHRVRFAPGDAGNSIGSVHLVIGCARSRIERDDLRRCVE